MNYYLPSKKLTFDDLRLLLRRGQIYAFDIESCHYGLNIDFRLFVTVITPERRYERLLIGGSFSDKSLLTEKFIQAISTENPSDYTHYVTGYPERALCGVGIYARLCGIDKRSDKDEFRNSNNPCPKCLGLVR